MDGRSLVLFGAILFTAFLANAAEAQSKSKTEREKREQVRKKLMDHFNALQEQVAFADDGRYRVTLVYDFSAEKHFKDFDTKGGTPSKGWLELKSTDPSNPAALVWRARIKGDFTVKMEYLIDAVHRRESSRVALRSTSSGEAARPGEGVGAVLSNTSTPDIKEWKHELVKGTYVLTDTRNPVLARHNIKEREAMWLKRDAALHISKYGQSPEIKARAEGPDITYLSVNLTSVTLRLVRFEVQAYLDGDFVKELCPENK